MLTGRDAAHARIQDMLAKGEKLRWTSQPRHLLRRPVDPIKGEVSPGGPTTATRMDKFTEMMLARRTDSMIGKSERGPVAIEAIRKHKAATHGRGRRRYLVARRSSNRKCSLSAIWHGSDLRFEVKTCRSRWRGFSGASVHTTGPPNGKRESGNSRFRWRWRDRQPTLTPTLSRRAGEGFSPSPRFRGEGWVRGRPCKTSHAIAQFP